MLYKMQFGSHIPVLLKCLSLTSGDVLELGTGIFSTPLLHWLCSPNRRRLFSYENDAKYLDLYDLCSYEDEYHQIILVDDWDKIDLAQPWDVAFIDHKPAERRRVDLLRLANYAKYIIVHDSGWREEKHYHYKDIFPVFKYRYDYTAYRPNTTVLSNLVDLSDFSV